MKLACLISVGLLGLAATGAFGRGGGGCFEQGTPIQTPRGPVPIEALRVGDEVDGGVVQAVMRVEPTEYLEVIVGDRVVHVTAEHPFAIAPGVFRSAAHLCVGDALVLEGEPPGEPCPPRFAGPSPRRSGFVRAGGRLALQITAIHRIPAERPAYNLLVSPGGTFVAGGCVVHNKGCFLPETPILRADGTAVPISAVRPGQQLLAFELSGNVVTSTVHNVITHDVNEYLVVKTDQVELHVTVEHPFYVGHGTFKTLEALQPGDEIYAVVGQASRQLSGTGDGTGETPVLLPQRIISIARVRQPTRVYNLQTDAPNTYFANGIAVHNKGGGGGGGGGFGGGGFGGGGFHGGGGTGGNGDPTVFFVIIAVVIIIVIVKSRVEARAKTEQNLDFCYSAGTVAAKAEKTRKLLEFIARTDEAFAPQALGELVTGTFTKLQQCWQARAYEPMRPLLMPDLFAEHCQQLAGLQRNHELNLIDQLRVERVQLVNVRYPHAENQREFTALITATARDYYVDDRTQAFLRGDDAAAQFQEFWTFQRHSGQWLLREIEQTRESDKLKEDNFFEPFTDKGVEQVYGVAAKGTGEAGPWLEKSVETKATRIERLLNFLVQTDKLWDRTAMLERARQVFLRVMLAQEAGDVTAVSEDDLFAAGVLDLRQEISRRRQAGTTLEFRNLCVRKVELILVRNFHDNTQDEFTVRISAHAQRIVRGHGTVISQEADVAPFEEFWTFGRQAGQWKVKEVLPPAGGEAAVKAENVDEDSNAAQLQWYYKQTRAN